MNSCKRKYIFLTIIILIECLLVSVAQQFGVTIADPFINNIFTILFFVPIILLFTTLSNDERINKFWRYVNKGVAIFIAVCVVISISLSMFNT